MQTPILTRDQQKSSLSARKKKREIIKNVIINPHKTYWPSVEEELEDLQKVLEANLPLVRKKKINVPWNILKNVPNEERKITRYEFLQKNSTNESVIEEHNLIFGVNEVTKSLECGNVSVVLVAEVNPRILVQHILDSCVLHDIPVLVIPNLKKILGKCCGFESMSVAVKNTYQKGSNEEIIVENVTNVHKNYAPSAKHINFKRKRNFVEGVGDIKKNEQKLEIEEEQPIEFINNTKYHLHRSSSRERVFIPEQNTMKNQPSSQDFLGFSNDESMNSSVQLKDKNNYMPLKVKRVRGNKNRGIDRAKRFQGKKK